MQVSSWLISLLIPLAGSFPLLGLPLLIASQAGDALGTVYSINAISLRQSITSDRLLGRINASIEMVSMGIGLFGALLGGYLGNTLGVQTTLFIAVIGGASGVVWLLLSPIRHIRNLSNLARE
jgi:predicted MFS family arabinose efflux permease